MLLVEEATATLDGRLDLKETMRDLPGHFLVYPNDAEHRMDLALHLAVARALYTRLCRAAQEAILVALRLRSEEPTDTHGYRACDELGDSAEHDEFGLAEGREARRQRERNCEAIRETDDPVHNITKTN